MKRLLLSALFILCGAIPALAQHRMPINTKYDFPTGKVVYTDYSVSDLSKPEPQTVITQEVVIDYLCVPNPGNPASGSDRLYCDSGTGNLTCLTSTGANCFGGGGGGGGNVTSVGLAGPTGIPISNSPVTTTGTLTWAMPSGWVLGDLLVGNGANSVARLPAPTAPDSLPQTLISIPLSGIGQLSQWAKSGLGGVTISGTTDTIPALARSPQTREYTSNSAVAVGVPDPGTTGFEQSPAFVTVVEGAGAVTFTPTGTAVITYCNGAVCFANQPSVTLTTGQVGNWSSPATANWLVRITATGAAGGLPIFNNQLLSGGGVVWTGGLNFTISAATYNIATSQFASPQTNVTLATADPTNPRIDAFIVDNTGTASVVTGTPAGSPAAPSIDPTSQLLLTIVTVPANSATPTLSNILVYDENLTPTTEWTCTPSANFNCNSTNNPYHGSKDIEVTTAVATNNVVSVNNTTVNLSTYAAFSFNIRNKATWPSQKSLSICFKNGSTIVGQCLGFKNGVFGFNQTNTTGYQQIVIPLTQFGLGSTVVDRVSFTVVGGGGSIGFYLDYIQIQSAVGVGGTAGFQLAVNGANTAQNANLINGSGVTLTPSTTGGVTTVTVSATGSGGTVTSVATTSPITGGTITGTGTIACATCVTSASSLTNHAIVIGSAGTQASKTIGAGTSGQVVVSQGASADPTTIDYPDVKFIPAANCNNATAGNGWSIGSGGTVTCRAGTNNFGGYVSITDTSSTFATFQVPIPEDWDTSSNPYIRFQLASTDATNGHTIIPSIQVACYKGDGSTTDDVTPNAAHSLSTTTLNGNANRFWSGSNVQMNSTDVTGCVAGALMQITVGRATDTATNAEFYGAAITFPRLIVVQAN